MVFEGCLTELGNYGEDCVKRFKESWWHSIFTPLMKFIAWHVALRISWGIRIQGVSENLFKGETPIPLISRSFQREISSYKLHSKISTGKCCLRIKEGLLQIIQTKERMLAILHDKSMTSIAIDAKAKNTMLLIAQVQRIFIVLTMKKMPMIRSVLMKSMKLTPHMQSRNLTLTKKIIHSIKLNRRKDIIHSSPLHHY